MRRRSRRKLILSERTRNLRRRPQSPAEKVKFTTVLRAKPANLASAVKSSMRQFLLKGLLGMTQQYKMQPEKNKVRRKRLVTLRIGNSKSFMKLKYLADKATMSC